MKFEDFIRVQKPLAMVITIGEYKSIKPLLQEFYSEKEFAHIDDYCQFLPSSERFLLCNPHEKSQIRTPMMYLNAVTFIDRIPFNKIEFPNKDGMSMKKYKFLAEDRNGRPVELSVISETKSEAAKLARGIVSASREFINADEGLCLVTEEDYHERKTVHPGALRTIRSDAGGIS